MCFLTNLLVVAYASSLSVASSTSRPLQARIHEETVVLADCTGAQNASQLSSEVSYFASSPSGTPDDTAPVTDGQYRDWANTTTSAYFTDTGTTFRAVLGERGNAGDYAGTGNNGYANFTCWQIEPTYLYSRDNKNCFVEYECNHLSSPVPLPAASPPVSNTPSASSTTSASSGLSVGGIIGVSIGAAAGAIIIAAVAAVLLWRHRRLKKQTEAAASSQEKGDGGMPKDPLPPNTIWQGPGTRELEAPRVYHELHNDDSPAEIQGNALRGELDGSPTRVELHSHDLPPRYQYDHSISPGAYGNQKGPI